jgi:hypothetical protein
MRKYARALLVSSGLILGGVGIGAYVVPNAAEAREKEEHHPHIRKALEELREVRKELKEADHDFKGHREEALEAVDKAIKQLDVCLKVDKK